MSDAPSFPERAIVGSLGELARELSRGSEVPEELVFASAVTAFGAMVSGHLGLRIGLDSDTRLFTVLVGASYEAKKSSAMKRAVRFLRDLTSPFPLAVEYGIGSAEGLALRLSESPCLLLAFDEMRSFIEKTKVQASVLLPMVTSLFEQHDWDNRTKTTNISVHGARLSLIACCAVETYEHVWTPEAIAIGLTNRLFVVYADARPKVAWPDPPDEARLSQLRQRIQAQLARLPRTFDIDSDARQKWEQWYVSLPQSAHVKRLDTIGLRLMPILALTMDKNTVDVDVVERVIAILNYEFSVRILVDPIDADNVIAKLEEKVRRQLRIHGAMTKRDLRRRTHADRAGLWAFEAALRNLQATGDVIVSGDGLLSADAEASPTLSPSSEISPIHCNVGT